MQHRYKANLGNYYGELELELNPAEIDKNKLILEDYNGENEVLVSDAFANAFIKEFGKIDGDKL